MVVVVIEGVLIVTRNFGIVFFWLLTFNSNPIQFIPIDTQSIHPYNHVVSDLNCLGSLPPGCECTTAGPRKGTHSDESLSAEYCAEGSPLTTLRRRYVESDCDRRRRLCDRKSLSTVQTSLYGSTDWRRGSALRTRPDPKIDSTEFSRSSRRILLRPRRWWQY